MAVITLPGAGRSRPARAGSGTAARSADRIRLTPAWPLWTLFAGYPLWWALGFSQFIWVTVAALCAVGLLRRRNLRVPRTFGVWLMFLFWMVVSMLALDSFTRVLAFSLRGSIYIAATIMALWVYNHDESELPTETIFRALTWLWFATVIGGILGILFPYFAFASPLEHLFPASFTQDELVKQFLHPGFSDVQQIFGVVTARPKAPWTYTNEWGSFFAILTPFAVVTLLRGKRFLLGVGCLLVSTAPFILSLNRGLWLSLSVGVVYVAVRLAMRGRAAAFLAVTVCVLAVCAVLAFSPLGGVVINRLHSDHSHRARSEVASQTVQGANQSPVIGYGGPRPANGPYLPALGTQGQLWLVLYSHGYPGVLFFMGFFVLAIARTWRWRSPLDLWAHAVLIIAALQWTVYNQSQAIVVMMVAFAVASREQRGRRPQRPGHWLPAFFARTPRGAAAPALVGVHGGLGPAAAASVGNIGGLGLGSSGVNGGMTNGNGRDSGLGSAHGIGTGVGVSAPDLTVDPVLDAPGIGSTIDLTELAPATPPAQSDPAGLTDLVDDAVAFEPVEPYGTSDVEVIGAIVDLPDHIEVDEDTMRTIRTPAAPAQQPMPANGLEWLEQVLFDGRRYRLVPAGRAPRGSTVVTRFGMLPGADFRHLVPLGDARALRASVGHADVHRSKSRQLLDRAMRSAARGGALAPLIRNRADVIDFGGVGSGTDANFLRHIAAELGKPDLPVAISIGTARANRKPVLRLLGPDGEVFAWAKLGWDEMTNTLVAAEAANLNALAITPPQTFSVPRLLATGEWRGQSYLVIEHLPARQGVPSNDVVIDAARELGAMGRRKERLRASTYWASVRRRAQAVAPAIDGIVPLVDAIENKAGDLRLTFGRWHGDFTKWNMAQGEHGLLLWDWERSAALVPVGFDLAHLERSTIREQGLPADEVLAAASTSLATALERMGALPGTGEIVAQLYVLELVLRSAEGMTRHWGSHLNAVVAAGMSVLRRRWLT